MNILMQTLADMLDISGHFASFLETFLKHKWKCLYAFDKITAASCAVNKMMCTVNAKVVMQNVRRQPVCSSHHDLHPSKGEQQSCSALRYCKWPETGISSYWKFSAFKNTVVQESIPIGCVPTVHASIATRCYHRLGGSSSERVSKGLVLATRCA